MYSRADLSRTVAIVGALFLTAASTSAVAREFRATDAQNEDYPTVQALRYMGRLIAEKRGGRHQIRIFDSRQLQNMLDGPIGYEIPDSFEPCGFVGLAFYDTGEERSRQQAKAAGATIVTDIDRKPLEAAMSEIYITAQRDATTAQLIERIRKVE